MSGKKQNILIIGGGSAGVSVAKGLSKSLDPARFTIQLVTERRYFIHWPAMVRIIFNNEGNLEHKAFLPYDRIFAPGKAGEVVYGKVANVEDGMAHLGDGRDLAYDYLVLATGSEFKGPLQFPDDLEGRDEFLKTWRAKFAQSKDLVVIGGGAAGFEIAGEMRHWYPQANVTIIHALDEPFNSAYPLKFRQLAAKRLREVGITLILNDRASLPEGPFESITTDKGVTVKADLVLPLWGASINTDYLRSYDSTVITSKGTINVLPSLRVPLSNGKTNVWAAGDVIEWSEQKNLGKVPGMASVVVANIIAATQNKVAPKVYSGGIDALVVPIGPNLGIGYVPILWGITLGDWIVRLIKSKTLFVGLATSLLNV